MFTKLLLRRHVPAVARPAPVACNETAADAADAADERPLGCGWFDSSHALQTGLVVTEHASADAVAAALPLSDWLALQYGAWPLQGRLQPHLQ